MRNATLPTVFLLLITFTAACEPRGHNDAQGTKPVHCTVIVDGPVKAETANRISGRVRFRCAVPGAEKLVLKIKLEQRDGERWHTVATKSHTLAKKQNYAAELKYESRDVSANCAGGTYRTVVDWSRTSRKDTEGDNLISGTVRDPCKPRIFG